MGRCGMQPPGPSGPNDVAQSLCLQWVESGHWHRGPTRDYILNMSNDRADDHESPVSGAGAEVAAVQRWKTAYSCRWTTLMQTSGERLEM